MIYAIILERPATCSSCGRKHIYHLRADVSPRAGAGPYGPKLKLFATNVVCPKTREAYKTSFKVPEDTINVEVVKIVD
jgi:hypothetical protein